MKPRTTAATAVVIACTCAATPKPAPAPAPATVAATPPPKQDCGAGHLPRIDESSLGEAGLGAFLAGASKGTVAVYWDGAHARVVVGCHLDGAYVGVKGNGGWRFRATNRTIFRIDEITDECRTATHVVAAYITRGSPPLQISGILVPLPCPPVADSRPAAGCIARGSTGPARLEQAERIVAKTNPLDMRKADVATAMTVFALIPDDDRGITSADNLGGDCSFMRQGNWIASQYAVTSDASRPDEPGVVRLLDAPRRPAPPRYDAKFSRFNCAATPVFLECFAGRFDPVFFGEGMWQPADPRAQP